MIEIIEHKDYSKPANGDTIVEVDTFINKKTKLFKVLDGVWLDPEPTEDDTRINLQRVDKKTIAYQKDYCSTVAQKSKYLEQMTVLFRRINSTSLGQSLLKELSKSSPVNFSNSKVWDIGNMIVQPTNDNTVNRRLRATCIIQPNKGILHNMVLGECLLKKNTVETIRGLIFFHPNLVNSYIKEKKVNYSDPAAGLYHELLHMIHEVYNIQGATLMEEEYITFGHQDSEVYLNKKSVLYITKRDILLENLTLIKRNINNIKDPEDKKFFEKMYGFTKDTMINRQFVDNYINKYQSIHSEYNFVKSLNIKKYHKSSYTDRHFIPFSFDVASLKVYTIKKGFITPSNTIDRIKSNTSNILSLLDSGELIKILSETTI